MLFSVLALVYFFRLRRLDSPTGADGFFYLKQILDLSEHHSFYYKDYSLAFALPVAINLIAHNPLISYQLATCAVFGGIGWATDRLLRDGFTRTWQLWAFRLAAGFFFCYSLPFLDLNLVFLKTATAVFFLLLAMERARAGALKSSAAALIGAVFSHKLVLFMAVIGLALWAISRFKSLGWKVYAAIALSGLVTLAGAAAVYPNLREHVKFVIDNFSFEKLSPASLLEFPDFSIFMGLLLVAAAALVVLAWRETKERRWIYWLGAIVMISPLVFPDPLNSNTVSYRLLLIASPFFMWTIGTLSQRQSHLARTIAIALWTASAALYLHFNRPLATWENPWAHRLPNAAEIAKHIPANATLYTPHGAEFYLAYVTPFRPRSFLISDDISNSYRIAFVNPYLRPGSLLENDLQQSKILEAGPGFFLLRESEWRLIASLHLIRPHTMNMLEYKPRYVADY